MTWSRGAKGSNGFHSDFCLRPFFLYPLPLALLLAPLGWLPFHSAYIVWVTLTLLMVIVSLVILLSLETNARRTLFFIPLLIEIMLFRPTILTLTQGQVSGLFLFALVWSAFLWQKGNWFLGRLSARPAGAQAQPWAHPYRPGWHMAATQQKMGGPRRNSRLRDFPAHLRADLQSLLGHTISARG